ncbi:MAG: transcriptional regulator [Deferrisomatales bacterium]
MTGSVRQELLARLREGPRTLRELAAELGLREKEAAEHLGHARRSLGPGERLHEDPAECLSCGFSFRKRDRLTTPGRCPRCRGERVRPARFRVAVGR